MFPTLRRPRHSPDLVMPALTHRWLCAFALAAPLSAAAFITDITVDSVKPFAGGASFGDAGSYERVSGSARGELDPFDVRNRGIVNIDKAPRNAGGNV